MLLQKITTLVDLFVQYSPFLMFCSLYNIIQSKNSHPLNLINNEEIKSNNNRHVLRKCVMKKRNRDKMAE